MFSSAQLQIQGSPIYSLPHLYISGLNLSVASGTVIAIAPGQARDSNDVIDMPVGFPDLQGNVNPPVLNLNYMQPLYVNSAVIGANGLDQGTLAAAAQYGVWLIGDSRSILPVAGLLSLTSNAYPLLPSGYDSLRLLGFVGTTSTAFTSGSILNAVNLRAFYLQPAISVLGGGNATSFTAIDLSSSIPTAGDKDVIAYLNVTFIPSADGAIAQFRPTGSSATTGLVTITGQFAGVPQQQYQQVICGVGSTKPEIDYKVSNSGDSLSVLVVGYSFTTT